MGVPHGGAVLQKGSDKRGIRCFAAGFRTEAEIPSDHPQAGKCLENDVHISLKIISDWFVGWIWAITCFVCRLPQTTLVLGLFMMAVGRQG